MQRKASVRDAADQAEATDPASIHIGTQEVRPISTDAVQRGPEKQQNETIRRVTAIKADITRVVLTSGALMVALLVISLSPIGTPTSDAILSTIATLAAIVGTVRLAHLLRSLPR